MKKRMLSLGIALAFFLLAVASGIALASPATRDGTASPLLQTIESTRAMVNIMIQPAIITNSGAQALVIATNSVQLLNPRELPIVKIDIDRSEVAPLSSDKISIASDKGTLVVGGLNGKHGREVIHPRVWPIVFASSTLNAIGKVDEKGI